MGVIWLWFLSRFIYRASFGKRPEDQQMRQDFTVFGEAIKQNPSKVLWGITERLVILMAILALIPLILIGIIEEVTYHRHNFNGARTPSEIQLAIDKTVADQKHKELEDRKFKEYIRSIKKLPICTVDTPKGQDCKPDHAPPESDDLFYGGYRNVQ
jgi:hypothetical protein